jgi:hypothetical protein
MALEPVLATSVVRAAGGGRELPVIWASWRSSAAPDREVTRTLALMRLAVADTAAMRDTGLRAARQSLRRQGLLERA